MSEHLESIDVDVDRSVCIFVIGARFATTDAIRDDGGVCCIGYGGRNEFGFCAKSH